MARITMEVIQHYNVVQSFLPDLTEAARAAGVPLPDGIGRDEPWFHAVTSADGLLLRFAERSFGISFTETEITGTPGQVLTYRYFPSGVLAVSGFGPDADDVLILREGERFYSDKTDPYGFALVYDTRILHAEQLPHGARIHLEYSVLAAGQILEHNEVILEASE
ncbi:MAG: hypothetical protein II776_01500 [Clostridia bacterium]|nr:hypothetical protein [Clostridia bacterium]